MRSALLASSVATLAIATISLGCELPTDTLPNDIAEGFAVQVQNPEFPSIHNRYLNLWEAGGGDQHLFLSPAGANTTSLTLVDGVITQVKSGVPTIRAVINGEYTEFDNTTKLFMTERGDPRAIFDVVYGCNPDTDEVQVELGFAARAQEPGGNLCVRLASGDRFEFRYSPPDNPVVNPERLCMPIKLAVIDDAQPGDIPSGNPAPEVATPGQIVPETPETGSPVTPEEPVESPSIIIPETFVRGSPVTPDEPAETETTSVTPDTTVPGSPVTPDEPAETETTSVTPDTTVPGSPVIPNTEVQSSPVTPEEPVESGTTITPETSSEPGSTIYPETPAESGTPITPETPENPDSPEESGSPSIIGEPETTIGPST